MPIRPCCRLAAVLLIGTLGIVELAAHLAVAKTSPAADSTVAKAPARVTVWYTQQPAAGVSRLDVTGPAGKVTLGDLEVDAKERSMSAPVRGTLAPGRYEVAWRTAGDDGHVLRGTFAFSLTSPE